MRTRTIHLLLAVALVGAALTVATPTVEAQRQANLALTLTQPSGNVKPLQGAITFQGTVTFTGDGSAYGNVVGIPVTYTVSAAPGWAAVVISPTSDIIPATGQPGATFSASKTFTVSVTATEQAPAFTSDKIEITAAATPGTGGTAPTPAKSQVPIIADYFSILDVVPAETIKIERPQTPVVFNVKITNLGNANTKVNFDVLDKNENLNVPVPSSIILQSKQAGGQIIAQDVGLQVQTPYKNGYLNDVGIVTFGLSSHYALDPKLKGDSSKVAVVVTTKGFYVPGAELPVLLTFLGVAALAFRRRE